MMEKQKQLCPICDKKLISYGEIIPTKELFNLWRPIQFSKQIITDHKKQSNFTQLHRCPHCNLEIFIPKIIGDSKFYAALSQQEAARYYEDQKWEFQEAIKDTRNSDNVIEVGCGPGNFLNILKPFVRRVYGTEYNEDALRLARNKNLTVFGSEDDLSQLKGKFDKVFAFHVLEHVDNPIEFIKELCNFVNVNGKLGISVPNQEGPIKFIAPCIQNMPPHHATRWCLESFKKMALKLNLNIDRFAYEPLHEHDCYYYSHYWVNYHFTSNSAVCLFMKKVLHWLLENIFSYMFKALKIININNFPLLRGQSIYVLFSKQVKE